MTYFVTNAIYQFYSLPLSEPSSIQVNPAAGYLDMGVMIPQGQTLTVSLFADPEATGSPFYVGDWGLNFDGTGFNPDAWQDGTGAIRLSATAPVEVDHVTPGWVGGGYLHYTDVLTPVFLAGVDKEAFFGQAGFDIVSYELAHAGLAANLANPNGNTGDARGDTYNSIENLTGSAFNDKLTGDANANVLDGGAGNDTLDGGAGLDSLIGGLGNDTFVLDNGTDTVGDTGGTDTITSTITRSLASYASIENLTLLGSSAINGTGDGFNNTITGNSGANILDGGADNDTLDGGTGADTMLGGTGNDTYVVDNVGDVVDETGGNGTDTVRSSISFSLADAVHAIGDIEKLTLTGAGAINGTGNALNNIITGNNAANILGGRAGNDTLDGGTGADTMLGGTGNDTYVVDNVGDVVDETGGNGTDTVRSSISFSLADAVHAIGDIEKLTLTGAGAINGTGNALNNIITGNNAANILGGGAGNDTLDGGAGIDSLVGGLGNDTYVLADGTDFVNDGVSGPVSGIDTITSTITRSLASYVAIENLTLLGSSAINGTGDGFNNTITGNSGANTLDGDAGNDTLNGGGGNDTLIGGLGNDNLNGAAGNDTFVFHAGFGSDTITGFAAGPTIGDVIQFDSTMVADFSAVLAETVDLGSYLQITLGTDTLVLQNVSSVASLNANDFLFV